MMIGVFFYSISQPQFITVINHTLRESFSNYVITLASALILSLLFEADPIMGLTIFALIILFLSQGFEKYYKLNEEISKDRAYRQQILNSLPVGVITVDDNESNFSLNTSAYALLDMSGEEICHIRRHKEKAACNAPFWDIMLSKRICHNVKVTYRRNGADLRFLVSQTALHDDEKNAIGRIFYFIDITETEELEKRMHHSEKLAAVGELAAGAAHEIRNPLAVIHGFVTLMKQSFTTEDLNRYQVPLLLKEFDRINAIIEDMLLMARPGAPVLHKTTVSEILKEIPFGTDSNNDLTLQLNLDETLLMLDPKQMKQVLYNLYRNSREAIVGKGTISIFSKVAGSTYHLYFQDSGTGIKPEMRETLFHPFYTSKETGTGLGLPIVQRIIENHDGRIEVVETSSKGTTFLIKLPLIK
jgi:signal transduction histidine kinase